MSLWGSIKKAFKKATQFFKPVADTLLGGAISQAEAAREAERARDQAQKQYSQQTAAAEEAAQKLANEEEERKKRLAALGTQQPATLLGSYIGETGPAGVKKRKLGGY